MIGLIAFCKNFYLRRNSAAAALAIVSIIGTVSASFGQQAALTTKKLKDIAVQAEEAPFVVRPRRFSSKLELAPEHRFTLSNEKLSRPMFLFKETGCAINKYELDCRKKKGDFQIPVLIVSAKEDVAPSELHLVPSITEQDLPLALFKASFNPSQPQSLTTYWVRIKESGSKRMAFALVVCMPHACTTDRKKDNDKLVNLAEGEKPDPSPRFSAPPPSPPPPAPVPLQRIEIPPAKGGITDGIRIDVTVDHVPPDYDEGQLARLILSAMRGGDAAGVLKIEIDPGNGLLRNGRVIVRRDLAKSLGFAGTRLACGANLTGCRADMDLKEWLLDVRSGPPGARTTLVPGVGLAFGAKGWRGVIQELGLEAQNLRPILVHPADPTLIRVYLLERSVFRVELDGIQAGDALLIPADAERRGMRLVKIPNKPGFELKLAPEIATHDGPRVAVGTTEPRPGTSRLHIVLKPAVPAMSGWAPARTAKRLKQLLDNAPYRVAPADGRGTTGSEQISLTKANDGVIVWSGVRQQSEGVPDLPPLPDGISLRNSSGTFVAATAALHDARIKPNDLVSTLDVEIASPRLYDRWTLQIEPFNRSYGRETSDTSNDRCVFTLTAPGENPILLDPRTVNNKKVLRASVDPVKMKVEGRLKFITSPIDKDANCAPLSEELDPVARWPLSEDGIDGLRSKRVLIRLRGRWLLGLYAPQDLGASGLVGEHVLKEAKYEIFKQFVAYLEKARVQYFRDTPPASSTLGFDLALLRSGRTTSDFQEPSVVVGKYRRVATNGFRLDSEAERRLLDFMDATSSEPPPTFPAIGQEIKRYSGLFEQLAAEGFPPTAIYVGTATPVPDSCKQWREMSQAVDVLSGRPRVLGIVFANMSATKIGRDLGPEAKPVSLATLTRGYVCEAGTGSALLFVPFSDLTTRDPTTLLQATFDEIDRWLTQPQ